MLRVLIFLLLLSMVACKSKQIRPCPAVAVTQDSLLLYEKLIIRDTIVMVFIPAQQEIDTVLVSYDSVFMSRLQTDWCWSVAHWQQGKLLHTLHQKDTLLPLTVKEGVKHQLVYRYRNKLKVETIEVNRLSWLQQLQIRLFWWCLAALIVLLLLRKAAFNPLSSLLSLLRNSIIRRRKQP